MEKEHIENLMRVLSGYLEGTDMYEVVYSPRRGYVILRWDAQEENYYGVMVIHSAKELVGFIYKELIARITLETGSDHTIAGGDFDEIEITEAQAVTEKYLHILPAEIREELLKKRDPKKGLLII